AHFAHDEHALAAIGLDADGHLRVLEVAVGQLPFQLRLEAAQRHAGGLHAADERKAERAVGLDGVLAAEIRLIEDLDAEDVLRADEVIGGRLRGGAARQQRTGGENDAGSEDPAYEREAITIHDVR